jgi:hypothetical protein
MSSEGVQKQTREPVLNASGFIATRRLETWSAIPPADFHKIVEEGRILAS